MSIGHFFYRVVKHYRDLWKFKRLELLTFFHKYNVRKSNGKMIPYPVGNKFCDIAVITFNNYEVVSFQYRSLQKFFTFPFRYTVFDNSSDENIANKIKEECQKLNIGYVKLPSQEFLPKGTGSYSHGIAINYAFNNYLLKSKAKYIGLLDHDIFLYDYFDISEYLERQFFYGTVHHNSYIWPGLWFIRHDYIKNRHVDFRPVFHKFDTGGGNHKILFRKVKWDKYFVVKDVHHLLDDSDKDIFRNGYSTFDNCWLHCWNASDYMHKGVDKKMKRIYAFMDKKIKEEVD